jgi:hypothetical protein
MKFQLALALALISLGCGGPAVQSSPDSAGSDTASVDLGEASANGLTAAESPPATRESQTTRINVITVSDDGTLADEMRQIAAQRFVGSYYSGDRMAFNLDLQLADDGHFQCTSTWCLAGTSKSSGRWSAEPVGLNLKAEHSEGLLIGHPHGLLRVVALQDNYLLLLNDHRDMLENLGPSENCCFRQESANEALQQQHEVWRRKWEAKDALESDE